MLSKGDDKVCSFYCKECDFVVHLYCADADRFNILETVLLHENSADVMEKIKPGEIQHFSHPHNLILSHEEVFNDKLCDGCMNFIISARPIAACNATFFSTCAQLPKKEELHTSLSQAHPLLRCTLRRWSIHL